MCVSSTQHNSVELNQLVVRNPLFNWQDLQPYADSGVFYEFCDALEVKDGQVAPAAGWGLDNALASWGNYFQNGYLDSRE